MHCDGEQEEEEEEVAIYVLITLGWVRLPSYLLNYQSQHLCEDFFFFLVRITSKSIDL